MDNIAFIQLFIHIFSSQLLPASVTEESKNIKNALYLKKEHFLLNYFQELEFLFFGYSVKKLQEAVDEYEFHIAILSYFQKYGKLWHMFELKDDILKTSISVSYYNYLTNKIDIIFVEKQDAVDKKYPNLTYISNIKQLVFEIMLEIQKNDLDIYKIILFSHKFKEVNNKEIENE